MQNGLFPGLTDDSVSRSVRHPDVLLSLIYQSQPRLSMMWDYSAARLSAGQLIAE
jgi:hypothetical protein